MKKLILLVLLARAAFAADNIINAPGSGQMYLKDNLGRTVPAQVVYTTDGNNNLVPVFSPMMNINIGTVNQGAPGTTDWKAHDSIFQADFDAWKGWADVQLSTRASEATLAALSAKVIKSDTDNVTVVNFPSVQPVSQSGTWVVQQGTPPWSVSQSGAWTTGRTWSLLNSTDSVTAFQGSTWNITNVTGTISLPTGASTEATLSALNAKVTNGYGPASAAVRMASQIGNTTGAADYGAGTTDAQTLRVVLPTDQTAVPVAQSGSWTAGRTWTLSDSTDSVASSQKGAWTTGRTWSLSSGTDSVAATQSGTWDLRNISGTISLPTGASTAARQDIGNTSLANIDTSTAAANGKMHSYDGDSGAGTETLQGVELRSSASGGTVEAGTATAPLRTDPTGSTNQPVSITNTTLAVTQSTTPWVSNVSQFGGSNVVTGTGNSGSGIPRVTISNDSSITNISGTISLPTSASTAANQATGNASLASVDGKLNSLGQKTMAGSVPVTIASDQTAVPASQSGTWTTGRTWSLLNSTDSVNAVQSGSWTTGRTWTLSSGTDSVAAVQSGTWNINNVAGTVSLPTGASTSALQTTGNSTLIAISAQLPATLGAKTIANSLAVNIASDQTVPVSAAALPLPTGAATSALQTTGNASLSSIDGKLNSLGQKASTASVPVVIASDQSALPVSQSGTWNVTNISGTVSLPTGASTAANQATEISSLATLSTNLTGGAQKTQLVDGSGAVIGPVLTQNSINAIPVYSPPDFGPASQTVSILDSGTTTVVGFASQSTTIGNPTVGSAASFPISSIETVMVSIKGSWTGTLQIEVSMDGGSTYVPRAMHVVGTTTFASSVTADVVGSVNCTAKTNIRVRAIAAMTGAATISILESDNISNIYVANALKLVDGSSPTSTNQLTIKAASTAALATDTSAVVALNPNTALPTGANTIGSISNISGTVSLPTGAATSALQGTGNTSLASIDGKLNSLGQKTGAGSVPVVLASDQPTLTVSGRVPLTANSATAVSVGVATGLLVSANAGRKGLVLVNLSANTVSLGFGASAVLNTGITMYPGATFTMDEFTFNTAAVNAIASSASSVVAVQEFQ